MRLAKIPPQRFSSGSESLTRVRAFVSQLQAAAQILCARAKKSAPKLPILHRRSWSSIDPV